MTPIVLATCGALLRLDAFLLNPSLSTDEAALTKNIIERSWSNLLGPLDYAQSAPPGFLLAQKTAVSLLGPGELALRLLPLLFGLGSIWLCWLVARRALTRLPATFALGLFAFNNELIHYSSQAKPYAGDVATALLIVWLAFKLLEPSTTLRRAVWLGLVGGLSILFSYASVFILVASSGTCWLIATRRTRSRAGVAVGLCIWLAAAGIGVLLGQRSLSATDAAYLHSFWSPGFMPLTADAFRWLLVQMQKIFRWTGGYRASIGWVLMLLAGLWSLVKRRPLDDSLLVVMPLPLVIAAAAAQAYPLTFGRVNLFLMPFLLMLVAAGAGWFRDVLGSRARFVGLAPFVAVGLLAALATVQGFREPYNGDLRIPLQALKNDWHDGDRVYVHYAAGQVFSYYAPQYGIRGIDYVIGRCSDDRQRLPLRELDALRGQPRVWIVTLGVDEGDVFARYLEAIGRRMTSVSTSGSNRADVFERRGSVSLYDLTRAPQSEGVSAQTFQYPDENAGGDPHGWSCYGVFAPIEVSARQ